jgi:3-hydroxyisobutyrate dehydrogenase-like beta-hydroxyacid dehydrogenase
MGTGEMSVPLAVTMRKGKPVISFFEGRAKRAFRTVRMEVATAVQNAAGVIRIIIFLHSAKDFPSVLRLYGIEKPSEA